MERRLPRFRSLTRWSHLAILLILVACGRTDEAGRLVELTITVSPATSELTVTRQEHLAPLSVLSSLDDEDALAYTYQLLPGVVTIEATAPGYSSYVGQVAIQPEDSKGISISLSRIEVESAPRSITVDAGLDLTVSLDQAAGLQGFLAFEGFDTPPAVSWSRLSGPGEVAFDPSDALATSATFTAAGNYIVELRAVADGISAADTVSVTVTGVKGNEPSDPGDSGDSGGEDDAEDPGDEPSHPNPSDNPRLGLHVTQQELDIWRERATSGPYKNSGDVSDYSPGDWQRIVKNAEAFLRDPQESAWEGPEGNGCITRDAALPFITDAHLPRDAAFTDLVLGTTKYRDSLKAFLLQHASDPRLDLSDRTRWCQGKLNDHPFGIANWFTIMLFTYDYVGNESFSVGENYILRSWFLNAAEFFRFDADNSLNKLFVNRPVGDYRFTAIPTMGCGRVTHYGGWETCSLQLHYNNRRAAMVRYFGLAGIRFNVESLQESAKLFFKEFITYSVYPDGMMGEYERWRSDLPDLGWAYAAKAVATLVTLADHFARIGDSSLYEFQTSSGALGTEGGPKSLLLAIKRLQALAVGQLDIYGTNRSDCLDSRCRIDAVNTATNWYGIHDIMLAPANLYYDNPGIRSVYLRDGVGTGSYPRYQASSGPNPAWMGDWGIYAGVMFMFGQTEGQVAFP